MIKTLLVAILCVGGASCVKMRTDEILTVTTRMLGLDVSQDPATGFYHARLGFSTTQVHRIPTATNAIHAPDLYSSIDVGQKLMSTRISEDFATGKGVDRIDNSKLASPAKLGAQRQK